MLAKTPQSTRLIVMIVMVIAAIIIAFAVPMLTKQGLDTIIPQQQARFERLSASEVQQDRVTAKLIEDTPYLVSLFFTIWMGLSVAASMVVLVIAYAYYRGEDWARAVALICFAMPSVAGAYMLIPWINFVGFGSGFPPAVPVALLGLIPFFTILLAEKVDGMQKFVNFSYFLALGVTAAHSFSNSHAALRVQWMHPARPNWPDTLWVLWLGPQTMWWGTLFLVLAIVFLGLRKQAGWYLALAGGLIVFFTNAWIHFVRATTSDYWLGALFGLIIVVLALIPAFKQRLFDPA
jgi:hypothetical protein